MESTANQEAGRTAVARAMVQFIVGGLFVLLDVDIWRTQKTGQSAPDGRTVETVTGWRFDLIPDEIGHAVLALAFFGIAAAAKGSLRAWFKALGSWQVTMILFTLLGHRVDDVAITEATEFGSRTITRPHWDLTPLLVPLEGMAALVAGWCMVKLCRSLDLFRGARLWSRYTWLTAAITAFQVASAIYFLTLWFADSPEPMVGALSFLTRTFVVFAILAVLVLIALGWLFLHACLGTRAEAQAPGG